MLIDELLDYLFDGQPHLLAQSMGQWLTSSRRFTAFATTFRAKIRKKLRATDDAERLLDLRLELETAYLLLQERPLSLVYEPQTRDTRGPDFAVTYTTSLTFMVEVTRVRASGEATPETPADASSTPTVLVERLAETIGGKLGQFLPQHGHVLLVGVGALPVTSDDVRAAVHRLQQRAERNDVAFLHRHRLRDRAGFFNHLLRLSEVLVRGTPATAAEPVVWINPLARYPLPGKVRTALYRGLGR